MLLLFKDPVPAKFYLFPLSCLVIITKKQCQSRLTKSVLSGLKMQTIFYY